MVALVCEISLLVVNVIIIRPVAILPGEERLSVPKVSCHERPSAAATQGIGAGGGVDRSLGHPRLVHPDRRGLDELPAPLLAQDLEATHACVRAGAV